MYRANEKVNLQLFSFDFIVHSFTVKLTELIFFSIRNHAANCQISKQASKSHTNVHTQAILQAKLQ